MARTEVHISYYIGTESEDKENFDCDNLEYEGKAYIAKVSPLSITDSHYQKHYPDILIYDKKNFDADPIFTCTTTKMFICKDEEVEYEANKAMILKYNKENKLESLRAKEITTWNKDAVFIFQNVEILTLDSALEALDDFRNRPSEEESKVTPIAQELTDKIISHYQLITTDDGGVEYRINR